MFLKHFTLNSISPVTLDIFPHLPHSVYIQVSHPYLVPLPLSVYLSSQEIHYDILDALVEEMGAKYTCIQITT